MEDGRGENEVVVENLSIARGGPIYVPNLVGPLTCVPNFENHVLHQLHDLNRELSSEADEDISVDELRIFSEEELVDMALKEAFKDKENAGDPRLLRDKDDDGAGCSENSEEQSSSQGSEDGSNMLDDNNASRKSKKRKVDKRAVDESYLPKVNELVKIKQKQNRDKASVRLHCFSERCKSKGSAKPSLDANGKLQSLRSTHYTKQPLKPSDSQAVQLPEVVICLEIYHNIRKWVKTQEFLVLGRQNLAEIRDKICCLTDQVMQKAGQHDPSGYFLINDVFYNDLRHPSTRDYSEPIIDWLVNSKDGALKKWDYILSGELQGELKDIAEKVPAELPRFRHVEMQKTRFCDLRFRLGAGYLYCHQGNCKHTMVVRDMRLIHPADIQNRTAYPLVTFQLKYRWEKCNVCRIYTATKVTVDDKWVPYNPCYFCNDCYYLLHHNEDGSLLYSDFSVFDYVHD
ncbi:hypothetical protein Tsubulata_034582 [Turnera subulata]|uniref:snRNA-activating protein complex subunit 3 n=1 Tax=Turnera subulata TaxID=218843 RepID=A0A9Q0FDW7_9ROSI|nr:hypothetical protein Tsubulata_034582 [Turnera subulata]